MSRSSRTGWLAVVVSLSFSAAFVVRVALARQWDPVHSVVQAVRAAREPARTVGATSPLTDRPQSAAETSVPQRIFDGSKTTVIERPATEVLEKHSGPIANGTSNPTVAPGLVRWHPSFAAACKAAEQSGKSVLLFQLLGRLDQEFC